MVILCVHRSLFHLPLSPARSLSDFFLSPPIPFMAAHKIIWGALEIISPMEASEPGQVE